MLRKEDKMDIGDTIVRNNEDYGTVISKFYDIKNRLMFRIKWDCGSIISYSSDYLKHSNNFKVEHV